MKTSAQRMALALGLICLAHCGPSTAQDENTIVPDLRIATGTLSGAYNDIGKIIKLSMEGEGKYILEVVETAGSIENIGLLQQGNADFALIQGGLHAGLDDLLALANIDDQYAHAIVPVGSDIQSLKDFAGRRIGVGPDDGGSSELGNLVFNFCNLSPQPEIVNSSWSDLEAQLDSGEIDGAFLVFSLYASYIDTILDSGKYHLIPIHEARAISRYLSGVHVDNIPPHAYGPNRSMPPLSATGLPTISVDTLLIARPGVPKSAVRAMLRNLYSIEVIKLAGLPTLTETSGRNVVDLPLHPAADDYYRRNDPITSDMFEIASFFLAGLITLASAVHFLSGHQRKRAIEKKRRRIVPYFENLLRIGEQVENADQIAGLLRLIHEMMSTQRLAEQEWLQGKLDTEHMENLYSIYNTRSGNAFNKIFQIQNSDIDRKFEDLAPVVLELAKKNNIEIPTTLRNVAENR